MNGCNCITRALSLSLSLTNRGKFGVVYKCEEKKTHQMCAVKVMKKRNNKQEDVEREVHLLKQLDHPHLLAFKAFTTNDYSFVLVTEL